MDIKMRVRSPETGNEWEETMKGVHTSDPIQHAKDVIDNWNNTLRPHDKPREFVSAEVVSDEVTKPHVWDKVNLVTIVETHRSFDKYQCVNCNVKGKRFTLGGDIIRDPRYKADKFIFCKN